MNNERPGQRESVDLDAKLRAYQAVCAVLSDDHNPERAAAGARETVTAVFAESGAPGLAEMALELSLKLASAIERIAADQGLAAVDLADVWFVD
jgi:hypothetical protein